MYGGHFELAKRMISKGANDFNAGLCNACHGGHLQLAELMISMTFGGARFFNWGLRGACEGGHIKLVELMISKGADNLNLGLYSACRGRTSGPC